MNRKVCWLGRGQSQVHQVVIFLYLHGRYNQLRRQNASSLLVVGSKRNKGAQEAFSGVRTIGLFNCWPIVWIKSNNREICCSLLILRGSRSHSISSHLYK